MTNKTVWIEVDVKDELPEIDKVHPVVFDGHGEKPFIGVAIIKEDNRFYSLEHYGKHKGEYTYVKNITHWLKKVTISIYSEQEIKEIDDKESKWYHPDFAFKYAYKMYQDELLKKLER